MGGDARDHPEGRHRTDAVDPGAHRGTPSGARSRPDAEVARRLSYDSSSAEHWKERAEKADALVREVSDILGIHVIDGKWGYGAGVVTLQQLRESFGRYLIAEKQVDAALQHKLTQVRAVREAAVAAEKALKAVGVQR